MYTPLSLRTVFERLKNASLTINLAKCEFAKATITYLAKRVRHGQVCPMEEKVLAIKNIQIPSTRQELRRFLGHFSVLTSLLSPSMSFVWTQSCQHAFDSVKALLCKALILFETF